MRSDYECIKNNDKCIAHTPVCFISQNQFEWTKK